MRRDALGLVDVRADRHERLRIAALAPADVAIHAWRAWSADADPWRFDPASQWWLPLVWWNLRDVLPDSPERTALRHEYRQAWIRTQHLLAQIEPTLQALHHEGIQTLLLKGAALALTTYDRPGLRPFGDVDVLVKPEAAPAARHILEQHGWTPYRRVVPTMLPVIPSLGYTNPHGVDLDLHWHALAECCGTDVDRGFWDRAVPLSLGETPTHALCPADQLLHVCTHGRRFTPVPTRHWMADAVMILRRGAIGWDVFLAEARRRCLTFQLRRALSALDSDLDRAPQAVMASLDATPARWWERVEHHAKRKTTRSSVAVQSWCTEARSRSLGGDRSIGLTARLQASAYSDSRGQLAGRITLAALGLGRRRATHAFDAYGRRVQFDSGPGVNMRQWLRALEDRLPAFPPLRRPGPPDRVYQLLRIDHPDVVAPDYRVTANRERLAAGSTLDDIADHVVADLQAFLALAAAGRTFIHAGVVGLHGRAIVLPGESGSGKSTLVAALLRAGAIYASDEFAILDDAGRVHPYPRPLKLRHVGEADEHIRPARWGARTSVEPLKAGLLLFARYRPDSQFAPQSLSASAAMLRLLNHCPGAQGRPAETMAGLRALVETTTSWVAERGDTDSVVQALLTGSIGQF